MVPVILSEFQCWNSKFSKRSLIVLLSVLMASGITSLLKPDFCLQSIIIFLIWLGWLSGKQSWSEIKYEEWISQSKISILSFLFGKLFSILFLSILHLFLVFPVFVLMMIMRGIPYYSLLTVFLLMVLSSITAMLFTFIFSWSELKNYEYLGTLMIILWIIVSIFFPFLNIINPILQVKNILETANFLSILIVIILNIILIFFLFLFTIFFLNIKKRG